MKLDRLNDQQNKIYSSKFEREIQRNEIHELFYQFLIISSNTCGCPDYFTLYSQPSSLNFLCHIQIRIKTGAFLVYSPTNAAQSFLTVFKHILTYQISFPQE